jgi:ribosomal protein L37AE/L43A
MSRQPHGPCPHCGLTEWEPVSLGRATIWRCENCGAEMGAALSDATHAIRTGKIAIIIQLVLYIGIATMCIWAIYSC